MPAVNLPLSGAVNQLISPWAAYFPMIGSHVGSYTINVGNSSNPAVEKEVLEDVASYGKQLGRIEELLVLLLKHVKIDGLNAKEAEALTALQGMRVAPDALSELHAMLLKIEKVKKRHARAED